VSACGWDGLQVLADDLTGACDVAAALLPWAGDIVVQPDPLLPDRPAGGLVVVNTATRTRQPQRAGAVVREVVARMVPPGWKGVFLKKIDTGLRGAIGAELDAVMEAVHAEEAFVLPAIPEVGRTTEGGYQLIDGVPVDRTPFGIDPDNPVSGSRVPAVYGLTGRRQTAVVDVPGQESAAGVAAAIDRLRAAGAAVLVCDARTDADLERAVEAVLRRPRPLVLAGSIGLARALRRALDGGTTRTASPTVGHRRGRAEGGPVLVVVGSAHPIAHAQTEELVASGRAERVAIELDRPDEAAATAGGQLAQGRTVVLAVPRRRLAGRSDAVQGALSVAVRSVLTVQRPAGLLIVGGETAYAVLAAMGHPPLVVLDRLAPLVVLSAVATGSFAGLAIVTKGGSSGERGLLVDVLERLEESLVR